MKGFKRMEDILIRAHLRCWRDSKHGGDKMDQDIPSGFDNRIQDFLKI